MTITPHNPHATRLAHGLLLAPQRMLTLLYMSKRPVATMSAVASKALGLSQATMCRSARTLVEHNLAAIVGKEEARDKGKPALIYSITPFGVDVCNTAVRELVATNVRRAQWMQEALEVAA